MITAYLVDVTYSFLKKLGAAWQQRGEGYVKIVSDSSGKWKEIKLSQQDKQILQMLATKQYIQECREYTCPITRQLLIDPVAMKCCQGGKLGEKLKVQQWLQTNTTCPLCGKLGQTLQSIVYGNRHISVAMDAIQILRKRIEITYKKLSPQVHRNFQEIIKKQLVNNYQPQHLVQILPSKWEKIKLNPQDLILPKLTKDQLIQKCIEFSCPIIHIVLIDPVSMVCCLGKQVAENEELQKWLQKHTTCPLCRKGGQTSQSIVYKNNHILAVRDGIQILRKRLQITYQKLNPQLRRQFQLSVKRYFGENYSQQHLESPFPQGWKKIHLNQKDRQFLATITDKQFRLKCLIFVCAITCRVVINHVAMKCCLGEYVGEKIRVQQWLQKNTKCPLCGKQGQGLRSIIYQYNYTQGARTGIQTIRKRQQITYKDLTEQKRDKFKFLICKLFEDNSIQKHLMQVQ